MIRIYVIKSSDDTYTLEFSFKLKSSIRNNARFGGNKLEVYGWTYAKNTFVLFTYQYNVRCPMNSVAAPHNKSENFTQTRFGLAEGLLRVLARKIPDAEISDSALALQMNAIANRLQQEDLYNFDQENNEDLEYLIGLMQLADYVIDIAESKHETKNILNLVDEIQTSDAEHSNIVDVMVLISKKEFKTSIQSLSYILAHSFQKPS